MHTRSSVRPPVTSQPNPRRCPPPRFSSPCSPHSDANWQEGTDPNDPAPRQPTPWTLPRQLLPTIAGVYDGPDIRISATTVLLRQAARPRSTLAFVDQGPSAIGRYCLMSPGAAAGSSVTVRRRVLFAGQKLGVPHHLPEMPVGVLEVARVAAPEGFVGFLYDGRPRFSGLPHDRVDLVPGGYVVPERELRRARGPLGHGGIPGNALARKDRELQTGFQVEEGHGPVLELFADDALRTEREAVPVKPE